MKKVLLFLFFVASGILTQAQSYLGIVSKTANFRSGPTTSSDKLGSLPSGTRLFVISNERINDYYHVLSMETNVEGYVYANFVRLGRLLPKNEKGILNEVGPTMSSETSIRVNNKSNKTLTLKLNDQVYTFSPEQKTVISVSGGTYSFRVSAPGIVPDYGTQEIKAGYEYIWNFSIP